MDEGAVAVVVAVSRSETHGPDKPNQTRIRLLAGIGVEGDVHSGAKVQHLSRVARDAEQPNLRQVHLIHAELLDALNAAGFTVKPGDLGENITTRGLDLLALPAGTRLATGDALIQLTGLRNPCVQLDRFQQGLMQATLDRDAAGNLIRKAGVMGVVLVGGDVLPNDPIQVRMPDGERLALAPV